MKLFLKNPFDRVLGSLYKNGLGNVLIVAGRCFGANLGKETLALTM